MSLRVGVITNPNSAQNRRAPRRVDLLRAALGGMGEVVQTHHVDEVPAAVERLVDAGVDVLVADGGDGAVHWLLAALRPRLEAGEPTPALMPTNAGTINFLCGKIGLKGAPDDIIRRLIVAIRDGAPLTRFELDSLRLSGVSGPEAERPGEPWVALGFASALVGVGQRFFDKFYAMDIEHPVGVVSVTGAVLASQAIAQSPLRHLPLPATIKAYGAPVFEPTEARVWLDGVRVSGRTFTAINVGSIDINIGGVYRFFHEAAAPGVLHVQVGEPTFGEVVRNLPRMMAGQTLRFARYVERPANRLRIEVDEPFAIDPVVDGELFYGLSSVEVAPGPQVAFVRPGR